MIYGKKIKLKKYLFKNKKSFTTFLEQLNSYVNDQNVQYEIELFNNNYSMEFNSFDTLIEAVNASNIIYYLKIFLISDKSQAPNKIELIYHNMDDLKHKTNIKLSSKDANWIETTEQEILELLEDKKNSWSFLTNDFITMLMAGLISILYFFVFFNATDLSNISNLLKFMIMYLFIFFVYEVLMLSLIPTFKIKWKLPLNPVIKYLRNKITDNIVNTILSGITGAIITIFVARLFR
ncbi:hypothetical protein [Tissierella sp.]|uniref:hypothetical protein n=1 Tax=Tissierella sp. TaxID=41274 RepID=UPI00285B41DA|nr:hypothetical protein [Tissierella sp.]MDR7856345.1 hypothetical protein [Tissierella sp.]